MKIITEPAPPVTKYRKSVPPNVAAAVAKSLEKLPADRFESAKAFSDALANPTYTNATGTLTGAVTGRAGGNAQAFKYAFLAASLVAIVLLGTTLWGWPKPAVVSRYRTVLWDTPLIRPAMIGRGVAISPDGGTVVFADSIASGWQLFAKERDRLDATPLAGTEDVSTFRGAPRFSPDGAWIAFVARDGKVKKVPRSGGAPVVLADSAEVILSSIAWLDGGTILYVGAGYGVRTVSEDGGPSRQVFGAPTPTDTASRGIVGLAGLPGGRSALVIACTPGCTRTDLRVLDLGTLKSTVLVPEVLAGLPLPGGVVAFVRRDGGVLAAPFDVGARRFTRPPAPVLDGVRIPGCCTADIAVSANGTLIYVAGSSAAVTARFQPVWVTRTGAATPIDSGWTVAITTNQTCSCGGGLALSPDGHRLALSVERVAGSGNGDIYVKQLDAVPFALTPLTFTGDGASPAWTVDGGSVVYSEDKGDNDTRTSILRRRADGTGAVDTLIPAGFRAVIEVVPTRDTGQFILRFELSGPGRDIILARRGDTTTTPLMADRSFAEVNPALSPDGRWLAYASNETGRFEVYVRPFPDVNARRVQVSQAGGTEPRWAHGGRELFFRNGARALVSAAVVPAATFTLGPQTVLFDGSQFYHDEGINARSYDVAPGDQRFVFLRRAEPTGRAAAAPDKLVEVTNWATEVRAKLRK